MTLQNGLVTGDRVMLWTDEAHFCAATGKMLALLPKAVKCQWPPFAVSISTGGGIPQEILNTIAEAGPPTIEILAWVVTDALRDFAAKGHLARALIAAWDEGPRLLAVCTVPEHGSPAFTPVELSHFVCTGQALPTYREAVAEGITPDAMRRLIDAQIATPYKLDGPLSAAGERVWFGGGVVQIEVSRNGVKERVIRMIDGGEVALDKMSQASRADNNAPADPV